MSEIYNDSHGRCWVRGKKVKRRLLRAWKCLHLRHGLSMVFFEFNFCEWRRQQSFVWIHVCSLDKKLSNHVAHWFSDPLKLHLSKKIETSWFFFPSGVLSRKFPVSIIFTTLPLKAYLRTQTKLLVQNSKWDEFSNSCCSEHTQTIKMLP